MMSSTVNSAGASTRACSVAKLTVADTPSSRFSLRSTRAAQDAQVMPPISSSMVLTAPSFPSHSLTRRALLSPAYLPAWVTRAEWALDEFVTGFLDGGLHLAAIELGLAGHLDGRRAARDQEDVHFADPCKPGQPFGDGVDAVLAGHAGDAVGGLRHGIHLSGRVTEGVLYAALGNTRRV